MDTMRSVFLRAILLIAPLGQLAVGQSEWLPQNLGHPGYISALQAFPGGSARLATTSPQMAFATFDGGATWQQVDTVGFAEWATHDLTVTEAGVLLSASTKDEAAAILRSEDGGITWSEVFRIDQSGSFINGVQMTSVTEGVAVADPIGGSWIVLLTSDGGLTWDHAPTEPPQAMGSIRPEMGWEHSVAALPGGYIWFGTDNSRVYRSTDGGASWSYGTIPSLDAYGVAFIDPLNGTAACGNGLARTTDGGATWARVPAAGAGVCDDVVGIAGMYWAVQSHRDILESTDNGVSWNTAYSATSNFNRIDATINGGSIVGWAGGGDVLVKFTTTITGGNPTPEAPQSIRLYQNYPNPFNPSTRITYTIPHSGKVELAVYDALGRRAAVLLQGRQVAGVHTTMFDAPGLSSGMYVCRLEVSPDGAQPGIPPGRDTRTVRMMLVR